MSHEEHIASLSTAIASKLSLTEMRIASNFNAALSTVETARQDASTEIEFISQNVQSIDRRLGSVERLVSGNSKLEGAYGFSRGSSQITGAQLLARPAVLQAVCDTVTSLPASSRTTGTSRHDRLDLSYCGCDLRKRMRSAASSHISVGIAMISNEHQEISRHSPSCPFYTQTKTVQRRVGARFHTRVWSQLFVLVQTSLACTTGAGGFSISLPLSFSMTVKDSPARAVIQALSPSDSNAELIKGLATAERRILKMFQAKEASPHDRFLDGSNLLHVCCLIIWKHSMASVNVVIRSSWTVTL